jgi:L-threonylcarbamoyladenylate synthase
LRRGAGTGIFFQVSAWKQRAEILSTETPPLFEAAVQRAAALLRAGEVVALPTETVYGLAANAFDARAVERIYEAKGRPAHNPIIVHVASIAMARQCVGEWPAAAARLARAFWPGPLTVVLPRSEALPPVVTAGGPTAGVRWPSHPFIQAVIRQCGFPLAAPSANPSNRLSPTRAEHVRKYLGDKIPLIVDGGQSQVGIESTVLDLSVSPPRLLRPGMIHEEALLAVTGRLALGPSEGGGVLKSPGQLRQHYAPRAKLVIWKWQDEQELKARSAECGAPSAKVHVIAHTRIPSAQGFGRVSVIPRDPPAFARAIYAELHRCDEAGAEWIVVEALPKGNDWAALADRLRRAAVVLLAVLLLCGGCQTAPTSLFAASGAGWHVQQGQVLWRAGRGFPELGGDLVVARDEDGRCFIQFAKTPMSLVSVQTTRSQWLIQFPLGGRAFSGRRRPPARLAWLYLPAALAGEPLPKGLRFEAKPGGGWRLENTRSGETLEGFLAP